MYNDTLIHHPKVFLATVPSLSMGKVVAQSSIYLITMITFPRKFIYFLTFLVLEILAISLLIALMIHLCLHKNKINDD